MGKEGKVLEWLGAWGLGLEEEEMEFSRVGISISMRG